MRINLLAKRNQRREKSQHRNSNQCSEIMNKFFINPGSHFIITENSLLLFNTLPMPLVMQVTLAIGIIDKIKQV